MQNEAFTLVCPECKREQKYRPRKKYAKLRNDRRKECIYCGRSFKVKDRVKDKGIQSRKDKSDKPEGFYKYRKSG